MSMGMGLRDYVLQRLARILRWYVRMNDLRMPLSL